MQKIENNATVAGTINWDIWKFYSRWNINNYWCLDLPLLVVSNFGSITSGTLGNSVRLPQGAITNVHCVSTSDITPYTPLSK